jgi:hypothetical protein
MHMLSAVLELDVGVLGRDGLRLVEPEPVGELHDVRLVDGRDLLPAHPPGVVERELEDPARARVRGRLDRDPGVRLRHLPAMGGEPGDQLLCLGGALLELDPGVDVLGRLPHDDQIDVVVAGADAGVRLAGAHLRIQVEHDPKPHVDRPEARADGGRDRALQRHAVPANRLERLVGQRVAAVLGHRVRSGRADVPFELDACRLEHAARGLGELRSDAVAGDESYGVSHASRAFYVRPRTCLP